MTVLSPDFLKKMQNLLGEEFEAFQACYLQPPARGLRVNTLKITPEAFQRIVPFPTDPVPFCPEGLKTLADGLGAHAYHQAGLYYIQEPSAMSAVPELDVHPGQTVLDLCAAPGGKSTQIAAALCGEGLLVSNEFVRARAAAILSNFERLGVRNAAVTSMRPDRLAAAVGPIFDRVLCDAPCSGEGMFRKEQAAVDAWSEATVNMCARRQNEILDSAAALVKPGGVLVYSTCTFSPEEDEQTVDRFLKKHPEFSLVPCRPGGRTSTERFAAGTALNPAYLRRVFPMDGGEGHFVAKLRKRDEGDSPCAVLQTGGKLTAEAVRGTDELFDSVFKMPPKGTLRQYGDRIYLEVQALPEGLPGVLRSGVPVGSMRNGRLIPEHGLFMAFKKGDFAVSCDLPLSDERLARYLCGEEIAFDGRGKGYLPVLAGGFPVGFGKLSCGVIKNHYPKGLRSKC